MERSKSDIVESPEDIAYIHMLVFDLGLDELQIILHGIGHNMFGGKRTLRKRILNMLTGHNTTLKLKQQILQVHLSKQIELQQPRRVKKIKEILQKYRQISLLSTEIINQTIRFTHDLPFFRTIYSLLNPIHCKSSNINIFNLTNLYHKIENIPNYISKSWDTETKEFRIKIILRLEQIGHTKLVGSRLPSQLHVSVNNHGCKLPKFMNVPIDITEKINFNKHEHNTLKITWLNYPHTCVAGVFLSEKLTSEDLLKELKKRHLRSSDVTKEFITSSIKNNDNMTVGSLIVTLKDPLTTHRMTLPARGKECKHLQCFDAIQFLQMNEQKQTWACPICKEQVKFENIEVDEFFLTILNSSNLSKETENVILFNDGTWSESKTQLHTSSNDKEIILIDCDEDNNDENFDNAVIEPKSKRLKCNPLKQKYSEHIAEIVNVLKTNVNSSTNCDIVQNNSIPTSSNNSIIILNGIPGPSSLIDSNCIANNFNLPINTNLVNINDSSKGNKIEEKVKSSSVITLD